LAVSSRACLCVSGSYQRDRVRFTTPLGDLGAMMAEKEISETGLPIVPSTKVAALLSQYPILEDVLIGLAPPFQKLKNPILRKTVGRVASLQQVAAVGHMPVHELVNRLRAAVGQPDLVSDESYDDTPSYFQPRPQWFDSAKVVASIEEKNCDPDKIPVVSILQRVATLQPGEILELITNFLPAPGIDILRNKNLRVWSVEDESKLVRTYVTKPNLS